MSKWGIISEINPADEGTWRSRLFLTIDVDWAPDFVIKECIQFLSQFGIPTTWFVTHKTPVLQRDFANNAEVGIHPNFSSLLMNSGEIGNSEKILGAIRQVVPGAKSFRNHSLVQSSPLLDLFRRNGFTHDCNLLLPFIDPNAMQPWFHWNGLIRVPHCWEDDVWVLGGCGDLRELMKPKLSGIVVLDIHPIHIYLNTSSWDTYRSSLEIMHDESKLNDIREKSNQHGVRTVVQQMLEQTA